MLKRCIGAVVAGLGAAGSAHAQGVGASVSVGRGTTAG